MNYRQFYEKHDKYINRWDYKKVMTYLHKEVQEATMLKPKPKPSPLENLCMENEKL